MCMCNELVNDEDVIAEDACCCPWLQHSVAPTAHFPFCLRLQLVLWSLVCSPPPERHSQYQVPLFLAHSLVISVFRCMHFFNAISSPTGILSVIVHPPVFDGSPWFPWLVFAFLCVCERMMKLSAVCLRCRLIYCCVCSVPFVTKCCAKNKYCHGRQTF